MNNPSREEFDELKEEVRKLRLQYSEPITIPRIELDPGGIQSRLDNHAVILEDISKKQDEQEQQLTLIYTDVGHMKTDIGVIKTTLERMDKRFDAIAEVQKLILERLPEQK